MPLQKRTSFCVGGEKVSKDRCTEILAAQKEEKDDEMYQEEVEEEKEEKEEHQWIPLDDRTSLRLSHAPPSFPQSIQSSAPHAQSTGGDGYGGQAHSPVRKKITSLQDRRVNTILLEALQLIEFARGEANTIDRSMRKLRDAIHGFTILVDKQVNIIGVDALEERGRVRADIQDLAENLRISHEMLDTACTRMKQTLATAKNQVQVHKRRIDGAGRSPPTAADGDRSDHSQTMSPTASRSGLQTSSTNEQTASHFELEVPGPRSSSRSRSPKSRTCTMRSSISPSPPPTLPPSLANGALTWEPSPGRIPLLSLLSGRSDNDCEEFGEEDAQEIPPPFILPAFFTSVIKSVSLEEKEFLGRRDLERCLYEMFTRSIAHNQWLSFMGKAFHRRLIACYTTDVADMIVDALHAASIASPSMGLSLHPLPAASLAIPRVTLFDFMCTAPFRFDEILASVYAVDANHYTGERGAAEFPGAIPAANPFTNQFTRNGGILHGGQIVQSLLVNRADTEALEAAEQTLAMAKLLHDLATAESEARHGDRLSTRPHAKSSDAFAKAYLATSKELIRKETGVS